MVSFVGVESLLCFLPARKESKRFARAIGAILVLLAVGCAHGGHDRGERSRAAAGAAASEAGPRVALIPSGPGHVFADAEDAVLDALAHCHLASARAGDEGVAARHGVVEAVAGGFRYAEPRVVRLGGREIRYRLRPGDVLHFRQMSNATWSIQGGRANRIRTRDRWFVDFRDPLHRPLYLLTPDRHVRVYAGREQGERVIGRFGPRGKPTAEGDREAVSLLSRHDPFEDAPAILQGEPDWRGARGRADLVATAR